MGARRGVVVAVAVAMAACSSDGLPDAKGIDAGAAPADLAADLTDDREPWDRDLSLRVTELDGDEGKLARLRVYNTAVSVRTPWRSTVVKGGVVEMHWRGGFDSNTFGEFVELHLDRDADGQCADGIDSAYRLFINNSFPPDGVVRAEISIKTPSSQGGPQPLKCAQLE